MCIKYFRMNTSIKKIVLITASLMAFSTQNGFASAYQIFEQDALSLGNNHAGTAASANDPSTEWYNPAGMTEIKKQSLSIGAILVNTNIKYSGTQTTEYMAPVEPSAPFKVQGGGFTPAPNFHYVLPLKNWAVGIGLVAPFGAQTNYGKNTQLRYTGTKTNLQVIDLTPAIAFKPSQYLSLGAGLDIAYTQGEFDNVATLGLTENDSSSTNTGNSVSLGYHLGTLIYINKNNRIGLTYHSRMIANLKGNTELSGPFAEMLSNYQSSTIKSNDFSTQIILPAWWDLSYYFQATRELSLMATADYTQWNTVKNITLKNILGVNSDNNGLTSVFIPQNFKNTWNFALGGNYQITEHWKLMLGFGYDMSPTNNQDRNIQIPDQNRFTVATGVEYQILNALSLALTYAHFFVQKASINNTITISNADQTTNGSVTSSANLFGLQVLWNF